MAKIEKQLHDYFIALDFVCMMIFNINLKEAAKKSNIRVRYELDIDDLLEDLEFANKAYRNLNRQGFENIWNETTISNFIADTKKRKIKIGKAIAIITSTKVENKEYVLGALSDHLENLNDIEEELKEQQEILENT